jgi:hypothetical protein
MKFWRDEEQRLCNWTGQPSENKDNQEPDADFHVQLTSAREMRPDLTLGYAQSTGYSEIPNVRPRTICAVMYVKPELSYHSVRKWIVKLVGKY